MILRWLFVGIVGLVAVAACIGLAILLGFVIAAMGAGALAVFS